MYTQTTYDYLQGLKEINSLSDPITTYATENHVPIMQPLALDFLLSQVTIKEPKEILELGTAIGYSGSKMLSVCNAHLITLEIDEVSYQIAKNNFASAGLLPRVTQILGDANETVLTLDKKFDFIFLDYAKGQYIKLLPALLERLSIGGILLADNVLFRGYVSGEEKQKRRKRTIVKRMREFLTAVCNHSQLFTSVLPICDGISLSIKRG